MVIQRAGPGPGAAAGGDDLDPLFPCGGDRGGEPDVVDAGVVQLEVFPEQAPELVGELAQGAVVEPDLAFAQVIHQQVADRPAGDVVAVDELLDRQLAVGPEHADGGGGVCREHLQRVKGLVEAQVVAPAPVADSLLGDELQQLKAVAGRDVADKPAFGGHDRGDPAEDLHPGHRLGLVPGPFRARVDQRAQLGEAAGITGAGHFRGQVPDRGGDAKPFQRRTDHIAADQGPQGAAEVEIGVLGEPDSPGSDPVHHQSSPGGIARSVCPAGDPACLPGVTGLVSEPVQHSFQPAAAMGLTDGAGRDERRREKAVQDLLARLPGRRPCGCRRARRKPDQQR
jgi:hypothetical protein